MTVSSKTMSIFVISIFEIGSVPTLRQFYETSFFGHLCHFLCHLHQFRDKILKNHAHIRNQHVCNRLCTDFETILRKFDFAQKFFGGSTSGPQRRKGLRNFSRYKVVQVSVKLRCKSSADVMSPQGPLGASRSSNRANASSAYLGPHQSY